MRHATQVVLFFLSIFITHLAQAQSTTATGLSAQGLIAKWRRAVHVRNWTRPVTAVLVSTSNEDGVPGRVEEWITTRGAYRRTVKREFDESDLVLTDSFAQRRDWNGFVRNIQGQELSRLRAAIFENEATVFGPPEQMSQAIVSQTDDHQFYLLQTHAPGGATLTWYVNAKTWLPVKSVRPGEDSEITTVYEDWQAADGMLRPNRAFVSETEKPDHRWERTSLRIQNSISSTLFKAPASGPSDMRLEAG